MFSSVSSGREHVNRVHCFSLITAHAWRIVWSPVRRWPPSFSFFHFSTGLSIGSIGKCFAIGIDKWPTKIRPTWCSQFSGFRTMTTLTNPSTFKTRNDGSPRLFCRKILSSLPFSRFRWLFDHIAMPPFFIMAHAFKTYFNDSWRHISSPLQLVHKVYSSASKPTNTGWNNIISWKTNYEATSY